MTRKIYWTGVNLALLTIAAMLGGLLLAIIMAPPDAVLANRLRGLSSGASGLAVLLFILMVVFRGYRAPGGWVWAPLAAFLVLSQLFAFLGYVLPWGQFSFWLAAKGLALPAATPAGIGGTLMVALPGVIIGSLALSLARAPQSACYWGRYRWWGAALLAVLLGLSLVLDARELARISALFTDLSEAPRSALPASPLTVPGATTAPSIAANPLAAPPLPANPLATPAHIAPPWPVLPSYGVLLAIPSKLGGVIAMAAFLVSWAALPWLDRSGPGAIWSKGRTGGMIAALILVTVALGWSGARAPGAGTVTLLVPGLIAAHVALMVAVAVFSRRA